MVAAAAAPAAPAAAAAAAPAAAAAAAPSCCCPRPCCPPFSALLLLPFVERYNSKSAAACLQLKAAHTWNEWRMIADGATSATLASTVAGTTAEANDSFAQDTSEVN